MWERLNSDPYLNGANATEVDSSNGAGTQNFAFCFYFVWVGFSVGRKSFIIYICAHYFFHLKIYFYEKIGWYIGLCGCFVSFLQFREWEAIG